MQYRRQIGRCAGVSASVTWPPQSMLCFVQSGGDSVMRPFRLALPVSGARFRASRRRKRLRAGDALHRRPVERGSDRQLALQRSEPQGIRPRLGLFRRREARQGRRGLRQGLREHHASERQDRQRRLGRRGRQHDLLCAGRDPVLQQGWQRAGFRRLLHRPARQSRRSRRSRLSARCISRRAA